MHRGAVLLPANGCTLNGEVVPLAMYSRIPFSRLQVPQYLLERKMQMAAEVEAQARAKEAALIPPGAFC